MIKQLSPKQLKERLDAGGSTPVVLDVRQPWETQICQLPGATLIPMGDIPHRTGELDKNAEIVVMCHHGVRSQHVAHFLQSVGFENLSNLAGGIDAWAKEVDPAMAKY
jgi:rhodanese-related sulfurtransferase